MNNSTLNYLLKDKAFFVKNGNDIFCDVIEQTLKDKKPIKETNMRLSFLFMMFSLVSSLFFWFNHSMAAFDNSTSNDMSSIYITMTISTFLAFMFVPAIFMIKQHDHEKFMNLIKNRKAYLSEKFDNMNVSDEIMNKLKSEHKININYMLKNKDLITYLKNLN